MRAPAAAILTALFLGGALLPSIGATGTGTEWWNKTGPTEGFHIRVPFVVHNNHDYPVVNAPAYTELDLGAKLMEAGWIRRPQGDRDVLKSFSLDTDSVRVVEMTDLQSAASGPSHGRKVSYDPTLNEDNPRRYEVPSLAIPGALQAPGAQPFDASTNPYITVIWRVEGTLQPYATSGQARYFMIYLDSLGNGKKEPTSYEDSYGGAALADIFWSGPGVQLYGTVAPGPTGVGAVRVVPLSDGTLVKVSTLTDAGTFQPVAPPQGFPNNPVAMSALQPQQLFVASARTTVFRVDASRPVIAFVEGTGFVPSLAGGLVGRDFIFPLNEPHSWEQDSIYFAATGENETVVQVRPLQGEGTFSFEMNTAQNPRPYTVGARSGGITGPSSGCQVGDMTTPSPLLTVPGFYRATVLRGDPVLLQIASTRGVVQVPSALGAPTGTRFFGDVGWTDHGSNHGTGKTALCLDYSRTGVFFASSVGAESNLTVRSEDFVGQVYPQGRDPNHLPAPAHMGPAPADYDGPHPVAVLDRPLVFQATDPITLLAGVAPPIDRMDLYAGIYGYPDEVPHHVATGIPAIHGPIGGANAGRAFSTFGASSVLALFNGTTVHADMQYTSSPRTDSTSLLGAGGVLVLDDHGDTDQLMGLRLDADRPVILLPRRADSAALAAVPSFLDATPGDAEFRGYMVRLTSPTGLNPVTDSTLPGQSINYTVDVTNVGHGIGGANLPDTIQLAATPPTPSWTVHLDRQSLFLQTGQSEEIQVAVTPPAGLPSGSLGQVTLRATSTGNPGMSDSLGLVTLLKRSFGVGLWFDQVGNPLRTQTQFVSTGGHAVYNLTMKNLGVVQDRLSVSATPPDEPGWTLRLRDLSGAPVDTLTVDAGAIVRLQLVVDPAPLAADGTMVTAITAASASEPSAQDQVVAITKIRSPSNVHLSTPATSLLAMPGETVFFPLVFDNTGAGSAELSFATQVAKDSAWNVTGVVVRDPAGRISANLSQLTIAPHQRVGLWVAATAAKDAAARATAQIHVVARVGGTTQSLDAVLQASVLPLHRLDQVLPTLPLLAKSGATNLTASVRLTNHGNLDEHLLVRPADLPTGWSLSSVPTLSIARNGTQELRVSVKLPASVPPGPYNVTIALVSDDGNVSVVSLPTLAGSLAAVNSPSAKESLGRPGRWTTGTFPVLNDGNVAVTLRLFAPPSEVWRWTSPQTDVVLPAGAQVTVSVSFLVPPDAPDGPSTHTVNLELKPSDASVATIQRSLVQHVVVGRPDLVADGFNSFRGPAGMLVRGQVVNIGTREADNVSVQLVVGDHVVDALIVRELSAKSGSNVTLIGPLDAGTMRLVLDGNDTVVESNEDNNVVDVEPIHRHGSSPDVGVPLVALVCGLAALWGRQRP